MEQPPRPVPSGCQQDETRDIQILQCPASDVRPEGDADVREWRTGHAGDTEEDTQAEDTEEEDTEEDRGAEEGGAGVELIHSGCVLRRSELLGSLQDKVTVRQRAAGRSSVSTDEDLSPASALPLDPEPRTPTSPLFLVEGLDSLGPSHSGPGLFSLLQAEMEAQLLASPQTLRRVLGGGFVQDSLCGAAPELLQTLILSNPQIQQLLQTNPELQDEVHHPQVTAQILELIQNPDLIQDFVQSEETEARNFRPRPKPTDPRFTFPPKQSGTKPERGDHSELTTSCSPDLSAHSSISPGLQSLLQQLSSSALLHSLLSGPHVKNLLQCLSHNPEVATQMLLSHPLLSENPQLHQQLRQQLPLLLQQMQSPEVLSAMLNPKAVDALLQIQQGLQTLASEAPDLIPTTGFENNSSLKLDPESVANKPRGPAVSTATEKRQQQQFVRQMLKALAHPDHKDLDPRS